MAICGGKRAMSTMLSQAKSVSEHFLRHFYLVIISSFSGIYSTSLWLCQ